MAFLPQTLIRKKRDGSALSPEELRSFLAGVTDGSIPDYQVSAMLMAVYFRGLDDEELAVWADAMLHSGDVLDLVEVAVNCEQNSLIYKVRKAGTGVCHTKDEAGQTRQTCYYRAVEDAETLRFT